MFRASSSDVSEFTDVAVSFVNTLTEQATETVTIRTFTNQKPWVDRSIRDAVNNRTAAYNAGLLSGNMSEYKTSCYALRRAIRAAKRRYSERIESHFQLNDSRRMWQGLKTICSSGNKSSAEVRADPLLAEELNTFYGRFDCNGGAILPISSSGCSRQSSDVCAITFSEDDVRRELKRVNVRKAAGPDDIWIWSPDLEVHCCYVQYPEQPSAHPSYSHYYLLSPSTLFFFFVHLIVFCTSYYYCFFCTSFFAHPIVFCTSYCFFAHLIVLHFFLFHCTFYSYFSFSYHMYALVLCYFI